MPSGLCQAKTYPVLFTEGSIVIVEGHLGPGGIFVVQVTLPYPTLSPSSRQHQKNENSA